MSIKGKIIYSKRIKEALQDKYGIQPVAIVDNPRDHYLTAWVFKENKALDFAITEILTYQEEKNKDGNRTG